MKEENGNHLNHSSSKDKNIDQIINKISLISAGFLALAALTTEIRSKILFQSWSFLFGAGCIAASCVPKNKNTRTIIRTIGATEVILTISITQLAKTSDQFKAIKGIQLDHASLFSSANHDNQLLKRSSFSPLMGRALIPNQFGHTKEGFRDAPSKPSKYDSIINIYGGSTTYDVSVSPEESWPNQLQKNLIAAGYSTLKVRNLGIPGGTTSEAIIYSSLYDIDNQIKPKCSIHFHGWNDLRNNYVPSLENSYIWHLRSMTESGSVGSKVSTIHGIINLLASKIWVTGQLSHLNQQKVPPIIDNAPQDLDPRLKLIYTQNLDTLISLGKRHGGQVVIAPQILNPEELDKPGRYGWLPNVDDRSVIKLLTKLNQTAQLRAVKSNSLFANQIKQGNFGPNDFTDNGHFSKEGSKKFANLLTPSVIKCLKSPE